MHYRTESEGISRVNVSTDFADQEWHKTLTRKATSISQLEERALVGADMSMLWVPKNPRGIPVYGYQGKVGYSLLNVLDPKAGGAMVEAILPEGKPAWLDQIRDRFLHPTSDSFAAYANVILGEDDEDDVWCKGLRMSLLVTTLMFQLMLLSNLKPGRRRRWIYLRRRRRLRKLWLKHLKRAGRDPDDSATLTEMMKKKALGDKKRKLDEQAAVALAVKKAKLQKKTPPAPSESEIDLGVFTTKHGAKPGKASRKVDISKITPPPTSPPSRTFGLSPPHVDPGKRKEDEVEVEQVGEGRW
ncbi:hypothetical protein Hdeb2414_s0002g00049021 [Helianthus debilis subsp. tardiflorus]